MIITSAATQGEILPITPPFANSPWISKFHGPAVVCDQVDKYLSDFVDQSVRQAIDESKLSFNRTDVYRYESLSWSKISQNKMK